MLFRNFLVGAVAILLGAGKASALTFSTTPLDNSATVILVSGVFEPSESLDDFTSLVQRVGTTSAVVMFNSPGGNPSTAIRVGRLIRALGLRTFQMRGMECSSACALAFMGGSIRVAETGAIGVHKSSFSEGAPISVDAAVSFVQLQTAETISYMTEMGIDPSLLQLSLRYEKDDMRYLSKSEMAQYRVTNFDFGAEASVAKSVTQPPVPQMEPSSPPNYRIAGDGARFHIPLAKSGALRVPKGQEYLRSGEDQASGKIVRMRNGDRVEIVSVGARWYKVKAKEREGYLHHNWVKVDQFLNKPFGDRYIQIKSFDNYADAESYVRSSPLPVTAYLATNKWYAVVLDKTMPADNAADLLKQLKSRGAVPDDAFMTVGNTYVRSVCCSE